MKLKFFTAPDDYNDYLFWRAQHHRYALQVIVIAMGVFTFNFFF